MKIIINKDKLTVEGELEINSGAIQYYEVDVEFDNSWDGLTKKAVIVNDSENYGKDVSIINNKVSIDIGQAGNYSIGVVGFRISYRLTTDTEIKINKKYYTEQGVEITSPVLEDISTYFEQYISYRIPTNLQPIPNYKGASDEGIDIEEHTVPSANEWEIYIAQIQAMINNVHSIPEGGTTGQFLKKRSNSNFDTEWANGGGGGGGTTNHAELDNLSYENSGHTGFQASEVGKGLSTNDFTTEEKTKLEGIEAEANNYVLPNDVVQDENYVHTDNNYSTEEKTKLAGLENYDDTDILQDISALQSSKVDKESGKGLSTNDYDDTEKGNVADNTSARHTHTNKALLDTYTQANSDIESAITNKHTHTNKSVLDNTTASYTTTEKTKLESLENYDDTEVKSDIESLETNKADRTEIPDVSQFITNSVNNLLNYYLKSEIYTKSEVNLLIGQIQTVSIQVVQALPVTGQSNIIYFVPKQVSTNDIYDEYIWVNNAWEHIGSTEVDLTGYATETWVNTQIADFLSQTQIQTLITTALSNYYNKTQVDTLMSGKANTIDIPTQLSDLLEDTTHRTVTDIEKTTWNNKANKINYKTTMDTTAEVNTTYGLGEQSTLEINLPATASLEDNIEIQFVSGTTPTNLTITSTLGLLNSDLVPEANTQYCIIASIESIRTGTFGWKIYYSEAELEV